jgi:hypothetical protein
MKQSLYYHGLNVWAVSFGSSRKRACERAKKVKGVAFRDDGEWFVVEGGIMPNLYDSIYDARKVDLKKD